MDDKTMELAEAIKNLLRDNLIERKEKALQTRDNYQSYKESTDNAKLGYLYEMKTNQIVGYIDALDDLLAELE